MGLWTAGVGRPWAAGRLHAWRGTTIAEAETQGSGASLRDGRGGGVSLSPEREAGLADLAETLATGAAAHGGKPAV